MSKIPTARSPGEELLAQHLACYQILAVREYQFDRERRYRADFFIAPNLLIEVEGGTWVDGRHNRPGGMAKDCVKYNTAVLRGFRVLRFTTDQVQSGEAIDFIRKALGRL